MADRTKPGFPIVGQIHWRRIPQIGALSIRTLLIGWLLLIHSAAGADLPAGSVASPQNFAPGMPVATQSPAPAAPKAGPTLGPTECPAGVSPNLQQGIVFSLDPSSAWRPSGESVKFKLAGAAVSANGVPPVVCFSWTDGSGPISRWARSPAVRAVATGDDNSVIYTALVPTLPDQTNNVRGLAKGTPEEAKTTAGGLVPVADIRVVATDQKGAPVVDVIDEVGITNATLAKIVTGIFVVAMWYTLYAFGRSRKVPGGGDAILQIISTGNGYASLSQAQIILWSFVVGASATYVMVLSGNLIEISSGTLVLLGISGVSALGSKLQSTAVATNTPLPATPGPVVGLHADEPAGETDVRLTWTGPVQRGQPDSYTVQYRLDANPPGDWETATETRTHPGFRVVGLEANEKYVFRVFGTNEGGPGQESDIDFQTVNAPAGAIGPVNWLRPTDQVSNSAVEIVWATVNGANGYRVEQRLHDSDESWHTVKSAKNMAQISNLEPRTLYDFRVAAIPGQGADVGKWQTITVSTSGPRIPRWSDLVVDSGSTNEIDVTRVQMLFFTVIVAIFVVLRVLASSEIPVIPESFLILMGISNSVYLGSKFIP